LFLMAPALTLAGTASSDNGNAPGWYLGTGLGIDAPVQGWDPNFPLGGGGNLFTGYRFSPSLALQLSVNPWFYTGGGFSIVDLRISPELRVSNPGEGWSPYVLIGPAYDFQFDSPNGYATSSVAGVVGIGFQFDFHPGEHAFIEGRYDFLIYNNLTQEDVPVLVGLTEDL
ncbi:MAG TPA: outer membrane beta-barrel protein, partial [bacterium]|nr:outer membrane beta-barrel protein [bacterium]